MPVSEQEMEWTVAANEASKSLFTSEAVQFLNKLFREFENTRQELLERRRQRQREFDAGVKPDFLKETAHIRNSNWTVAPIPTDLRDRRVEITGPVERKMIINALNSGAQVFMADLEDSNSPTWQNVVQGQINLRDAVRREIEFKNPDGKAYKLNEKTATLVVRPRGWHLPEKHLLFQGEPVSASLFDFGLYFFHNAAELLERGSGPYFYLPKMQSHLEARLWNDVFNFAQDELGIPRGSIRATVLIETFPAAFEMDEILYELRDHSAGLNCGRWDYIFSMIKTFAEDKTRILPDRVQITMTTHCMRSYSKLAIETCHRRGIHAIGGMAAQIPIKNDPEANERAFEKVRNDKLREANDGHDGTWVAHPGLVAVARQIFDEIMPQANQIHRSLPAANVGRNDLLQCPTGEITPAGLRLNVDVGIQYMAAWLGALGCVPIYNLMEDAATAEISRSQLWQWVRHGGKLNDGRTITPELMRETFKEVTAELLEKSPGSEARRGEIKKAAALIEEIVLRPKLAEFMTLEGYQYLP